MATSTPLFTRVPTIEAAPGAYLRPPRGGRGRPRASHLERSVTDRNDKDSEPTGGTDKQGDARDALVARRNVLFGLWAARELGLPQADREAYALSVHLSDYAEPGRDDVLRKVAADLFAAGRPTPDSRLREVLAEMALRAEVQLDGEGEERP